MVIRLEISNLDRPLNGNKADIHCYNINKE